MSVLRAWSLGGPSRGRGCHLEQADLAEQPIVRRVTAVTGAARVAPSTPNRRVPAVVTSRTVSGCSRRVRPKATGSNRFWRVLLANKVIASMARATLRPLAPRATSTAKAPAKNAPKNGM